MSDGKGGVPRAGLFGGVFDPVHEGHMAIARAALESLALDRLYFIPAAQAPLREKAPEASAKDRLDMLRAAIKESGDKRMEILDIETQEGGVHYTVDTVQRLKIQWPDTRFFWLMGSDQFRQLDSWREPEALAKMLEFAVLERPGSASVPPTSLATKLRWHRLEAPPHPASSSEIRRQCHAGGQWQIGLPRSVVAIIQERGLYR